jgi:hypothetical protein
MMVLALLALLLLAASEWLVRTQVVPQDEFIKHAKLLESSKLENAAFGDSHVARGFLPSADMLNLAYPSENLPQMDWKIRHYFGDKKPGNILLQADPHMFANYRLGGVGDYPKNLKSASLNIESNFKILIPRYRANLVNYWTSYFAGGGELKSQISFTENGAHLSSGDISNDTPRWRRFEDIARVNTHIIASGKPLEIYKQNYEDILDFLVSQGANICMVTFPHSPGYHEAVNQRESLKEARSEIIGFFSQQSDRVGARYVNLDKSVTDISKYRDSDHLNGEATVELSAQLLKECFG